MAQTKHFHKQTFVIHGDGAEDPVRLTVSPPPLKLPGAWRMLAFVVKPLLRRVVRWVMSTTRQAVHDLYQQRPDNPSYARILDALAALENTLLELVNSL